MQYFYYPTPHGSVTICATNTGVSMLAFGELKIADAVYAPSVITNNCANQVQAYFAGKRFTFDVPLDIKGSQFQLDVWQRVQQIPYACTNTTSDVARAIGKPDAHRSVGTALSKNPVALIIPDHRIVSAQGKTLGTGRLSHIRAGLLAHERRVANL